MGSRIRCAVFTAALLGFHWLQPPGAQGFAFGSRLALWTGTNPTATAIADLNGDGKLDLVVVNGYSNNFSVFLGDGAGGFGAEHVFATPAYPLAVAIGDVDRDGNLDVVVTAFHADSLSVLLGDGTGSFGPRTSYHTASQPYGIAIADLNGDGWPDLVVANENASGSVSVFLGYGGIFGPRSDYGTGSRPTAVVVGYVDGDQNLDVVTANSSSNTISVLLGDGAGNLGPKIDSGTGSSPLALALGDVNGDGRADVVAADYYDNRVTVLLGDDTGHFAPKQDFIVGSGPQAIALGDLDGDGKPDLLTGNYGSGGNDGTISALIGDGTGTSWTRSDMPAGAGTYWVALGDLNGDGRLDAGVANYVSDSVAVFLSSNPGVRTRTTVSLTPDSSVIGMSVTLRATVTPAPDTTANTVRFFDGLTLLGTSRPIGGVATLVYPTTRLGNRSISAIYLGAGGLSGSISAPASMHVVKHGLSVTRVDPASAGGGPITLTIYGTGFESGATVFLTNPEAPFIGASGVIVAADSLSLTATFDLAEGLGGTYDVNVYNPDNQGATLRLAFTPTPLVEAPQLQVHLVGPTKMRPSRQTAFDVVIQNPGNNDAEDVPLWVTGVPTDAAVKLDFPRAYPKGPPAGLDSTTVPDTLTSPSGRYVVVVIPRVPPGASVRRLLLTVPASDPQFTLRAAIAPPWADAADFRDCLSNGGISSPACMGRLLTALADTMAAHPEMQAMSGMGLWARIASGCEGAASLQAALAKARQVLGFMEHPVESPAAALAACSHVLPPRWRDSLGVAIVTSHDPNEKLGPRDRLSPQQAVSFSIRFENSATAGANAQQALVTDQINPSTFDPSTVFLGPITFGSTRISVPPGLTSFQATVPMTQNLVVSVSARLDRLTGVLTWAFTSIDPATDLPPAATNVGFLPPNVTPPQGEGSVMFTVMPRSSLNSGAQISNAARVAFDDNSPIDTPQWADTIDNVAPSSHVIQPASVSSQLSIPISWTADGSPTDLRDFTIFVAEDAPYYRVWRLNTTATSDTMVRPSDHQDHLYRFYSVARDLAGNIEAAPNVPDATIQSVVAVGEPLRIELALAGVHPNPTSGAMHVAFSLPGPEPASIELIDLAGRRVARRDVGQLGPGSHDLDLAEGRKLRPGLYFIRLGQGGRVLVARAVVIR